MFIETIEEMQKCNLKMLESFDTLCRKNDISYIIAYGTLLGYEREGGLIPWDDDIDVLMLRKDYEKFRSIPAEEIDPKYEIIDPYDLDYFFDFIPRYSSKDDYAERLGVFDQDHNPVTENVRLDIFILEDSFDGLRFEIQIKRMLALYLKATKFRKHKLDRPLRTRLLKWAFGLMVRGASLQSIIKRYEEIATECKEETGIVFVSDSLPRVIKDRFIKEWFEKTEEITLCGVKTFIPDHPKELLRLWFGDYETRPPIEKRKPLHFKLKMN